MNMTKWLIWNHSRLYYRDTIGMLSLGLNMIFWDALCNGFKIAYFTMSLAFLFAPLLLSKEFSCSLISSSLHLAAQWRTFLPDSSVVLTLCGVLEIIMLTTPRCPSSAAFNIGLIPHLSRDNSKLMSFKNIMMRMTLIFYEFPFKHELQYTMLFHIHTSILLNASVSDFWTRSWTSSICF